MLFHNYRRACDRPCLVQGMWCRSLASCLQLGISQVTQSEILILLFTGNFVFSSLSFLSGQYFAPAIVKILIKQSAVNKPVVHWTLVCSYCEAAFNTPKTWCEHGLVKCCRSKTDYPLRCISIQFYALICIGRVSEKILTFDCHELNISNFLYLCLY